MHNIFMHVHMISHFNVFTGPSHLTEKNEKLKVHQLLYNGM